VVLSATTTFLTVRQSSKRGLMQTNMDPDNPMAATQKYMVYVVPFFSLTGLYWQYGLVLYWVATNVWTLGQQYFMFRNWTTEPVPAAGATAAAAVTPIRARTGTAKANTAKTSTAKTATGTAKTAPGETKSDFDPRAPKTAPGSARPASGAARTGSGSARPASGNRRPGTAASRPKPASGGTSSGSGTARTGTARGDAAAASPNGQNGTAKRGLLRLGRQKEEPAAEPEVPATKVVRQQPVRQAKSKRSGKR